MRIGELAKAIGVSSDTLRHYERRGLLAAERTEGNYREYSPEALGRVQLIRRALRLGFSLDELAKVLRQRDAGGAPCREVRALAARKRDDLDVRISELISLREELTTLLQDWDRRLAANPDGGRAYLLESVN